MNNKIANWLKKIDKAERSGIVNMLIKPVSLLLSILYTPLLLSYLGDEKYGLWATVLSIISWINYFDVGIGNGLRNVLTTCLAQRNLEKSKRAVSTAYIILTCISSLILIVLIILTFSVDWFNVFSTSINMELTLLVTFIFICVNFVLSLANNILYALQLAEAVAIRGVLIQALNIIGIVFISKISSENLVLMAVLFGSTTLVINIANSVQIFRKRPFLRPSIKWFDRKCISEVCNIGLQFFVIQIMCLIMFTTDNILVSHFFGARAVTPFSVADKVFNTGYSIFGAFLVPYWAGTTKAIADGDIDWIKKSIKTSWKVFVLYSFCCVCVAFAFKPVVHVWLGKDLHYETGIIPLMCLFYILYGILGLECQFINGSGQLKVQLIMYIILGITNIPLSIFLGVNLSMRTFGIRFATAVLVFVADIVLGINLNHILKRLDKTIGYSNSNN